MREIRTLSLNILFKAFAANQPAAHARLFCRLVRLRDIDVVAGIRDHVLGDDWQDFAYASLAQHFIRSAGRIYLAQSAAHPELIKVGKTRGEAKDRIRALNNESVVDPFSCIAQQEVHDRHWVEVRCHQVLRQAGVHRAKEFFNTTPDAVQGVLEKVVAQDLALFQQQGLYQLSSFEYST